MNNIEVQIAVKDDLPEIKKVLYEQHLYHCKLLSDVYYKTSIETLIPDKWLLNKFSNPKTYFVIAKNNGNILGLLIFDIVDSDFPAHKCIEWIYIDELIVIPSSRNKGIGTLLINYVENFAQDNNIDKLKLDVWSSNDAGYNFYKNNNYSVVKHSMWKCL